MKDLVSVIIPSCNRFYYLKNAVESVKKQTYPNIEIIVINDGSNQSEYYSSKRDSIFQDVLFIHIMEGSRNIFGFPCPGYIRNKGIKEAKGKYIAFLDDDDIWFPQKLEIQITQMQINNYKMSCTDGLIGSGFYNKNKSYPKYNAEYYNEQLKSIFKSKGSSLIENGLPSIFDKELIQIHNCIITSSVIIESQIVDDVGDMKCIHIKECEDYEYWLRVLDKTNCLYIDNILFYYDKK